MQSAIFIRKNRGALSSSQQSKSTDTIAVSSDVYDAMQFVYPTFKVPMGNLDF
jgi:hypothetical protein